MLNHGDVQKIVEANRSKFSAIEQKIDSGFELLLKEISDVREDIKRIEEQINEKFSKL